MPSADSPLRCASLRFPPSRRPPKPTRHLSPLSLPAVAPLILFVSPFAPLGRNTWAALLKGGKAPGLLAPLVLRAALSLRCRSLRSPALRAGGWCCSCAALRRCCSRLPPLRCGRTPPLPFGLAVVAAARLAARRSYAVGRLRSLPACRSFPRPGLRRLPLRVYAPCPHRRLRASSRGRPVFFGGAAAWLVRRSFFGAAPAWRALCCCASPSPFVPGSAGLSPPPLRPCRRSASRQRRSCPAPRCCTPPLRSVGRSLPAAPLWSSARSAPLLRRSPSVACRCDRAAARALAIARGRQLSARAQRLLRARWFKDAAKPRSFPVVPGGGHPQTPISHARTAPLDFHARPAPKKNPREILQRTSVCGIMDAERRKSNANITRAGSCAQAQSQGDHQANRG